MFGQTYGKQLRQRRIVAGTVAICAGYAQIGMGIATANPLLVALSISWNRWITIDHAVTKANSR